jgi:hypothetical protein
METVGQMDSTFIGEVVQISEPYDTGKPGQSWAVIGEVFLVLHG